MKSTWVVDPARMHSRAGASPFAGRTLRGAVRATLRRGEVVARDGEVDTTRRGCWIAPGERADAGGSRS
jgi:dihydroorotase-like cyclic amidohydrolase